MATLTALPTALSSPMSREAETQLIKESAKDAISTQSQSFDWNDYQWSSN